MDRPMRSTEIANFADSIRALLADPDSGLSELDRRRWEGALAALEVVLGHRTSLVDNFDLDDL